MSTLTLSLAMILHNLPKIIAKTCEVLKEADRVNYQIFSIERVVKK